MTNEDWRKSQYDYRGLWYPNNPWLEVMEKDKNVLSHDDLILCIECMDWTTYGKPCCGSSRCKCLICMPIVPCDHQFVHVMGDRSICRHCRQLRF